MREHYERLFPGLGNSIRARVRYFDDFVKASIADGLQQLVILGAGYDTRAYRIEGLNKIKVFEVDHPSTQIAKLEKSRRSLAVFRSMSYMFPLILSRRLESEVVGKGIR